MERRDRVDGVRAPDVRYTRLGQAEEAHFARLHQLANRAGHLLDRHSRIDAVLIQHVDMIRLKAPQRFLNHLADVLRPTVEPSTLPLLDAHAKFSGENHLITSPFERPAQQFLVEVGAIHLGCIEEGAAQFDGAVDGGNRLALVALLGSTVGLTHAHAAEAERGDLKTLLAERSFC